MNKYKLLAVILAAVALLVISTGLVFAVGLIQGGPPYWAEDNDNNGGSYWMPMHGRRGGWSSEAPFPPMHEAMITAVSEATGLAVDEIEARLADGEHLLSMALDAGMTEADFFELMAETRTAFLTEALEAGWITEAQYQWMLERKEGSPYGRGYGGCHGLNEDESQTWGRGRRW
jgi:hypothetical protein